MEDPSANLQQLAKLSPTFARSPRGRALIEAVASGGAVLRVSQQDLCAALAGAAGAGAGGFDDPYRCAGRAWRQW